MGATQGLAPELFWLAASATLTGLFWVPYVINRMVEHGLWAALSNPSPDRGPRAPWAVRMMAAHTNAVENLVIFAPLTLAVVIASKTGPVTATAALVYFIARAAHVVIYTAGIPLLRTIAFTAGWCASMAMAAALFGFV